MAYTQLGVMLTSRCTAACSSCCFSCSPDGGCDIDLASIKRFIASAADDEELESISITGGEPFLLFEHLLNIVEFITDTAGKNASAVTNCFWAKTPKMAEKKISALKRAGLSHLSISYDHYHSDFIPIEYVKNALDACHNNRVGTTLCSIVLKDETVGDIVSELGNSFCRNIYEADFCLPIGRARDAFDSSEFYRTDVQMNLDCAYGGSAAISSDGHIYPCCSQVILDTGLSIGHYSEFNYQEMKEALKNNGVLFILRTKGLAPFYEYAVNVLDVDLPTEYVRSCELCQLLFSDQELVDAFAPLIEKEIDEAMKQYTE